MLKETRRIVEDSYTSIAFDIIENEIKVGYCSVMVDVNSAVCERIDINAEQRNKGFGSSALRELSAMFNEIIVAPDNANAKRLYERIGKEYCEEEAFYIDNGYGVFII